MADSYRLVTRSDFDGLVCAVLLTHLDLIDDIAFVHPKDMQDGKVEISSRDITTNLPYVDGAYLVFDHHESEMIRNDVSNDGEASADNYIIDADAASAARVVWKHYGGNSVFPTAWNDMMAAVDKADAAQYNMQEVLNPSNWELLNLLMDSRTGLGRFRDFRISNYQLMMELIDHCRSSSIEEILQLPDVQERVALYEEHKPAFEDQLNRCSTTYGNLVVLDLRDENIIYPGSRFHIYATFPECNISIHQMNGFKNQNTVFATGKSIFDRTCKTNVGKLMLQYGGGGHSAAGTCQIDNDKVGKVLAELVEAINDNEKLKRAG